jgi:pseudouridine kinase
MKSDGHVLVIGAAGLDIKGRTYVPLQTATSNPGQIRNSFGGVGRNLAENLARLEVETVLLTAVGDDASGDLIMAQCSAAGVNMRHTLQVEAARTGTYMTILDEHGDLALAVSDYDIMQQISSDYVESRRHLFEAAQLVVIDLNLAPVTIDTITALCQLYAVPLCVEPTSVAHTAKIQHMLKSVYLMTPNVAEAQVLVQSTVADAEQGILVARDIVRQGVETVAVTLGALGVAYANAESSGHIDVPIMQVTDATGAGDALSAGLIFGIVHDMALDEAIRLGIAAARLTLQSSETVLPTLSPDLIYEHLTQ